MFASRVGRVILDGVVNTVKYASEPSYAIWPSEQLRRSLSHSYINAWIPADIQDTDKVYTGFLSACATAGPTVCAIAETGSTADSIRAWVQKLMDDAYDLNKAGGPVGSSYIRSKCGFLSSSSLLQNLIQSVIDVIFHGMYTPKDWPALASKIYDIANTVYNNTPLVPRGLEVSIDPRSPRPFGIPRISRRGAALNDWAFQAITCADAIDSGNTTTADVFNEIILASTTSSEMCTFCRPSCFLM